MLELIPSMNQPDHLELEAQSDQSTLYRLLLHCRNDISYAHVLQRIAGPDELQSSLRKRARFLFYDHADLALPKRVGRSIGALPCANILHAEVWSKFGNRLLRRPLVMYDGQSIWKLTVDLRSLLHDGRAQTRSAKFEISPYSSEGWKI